MGFFSIFKGKNKSSGTVLRSTLKKMAVETTPGGEKQIQKATRVLDKATHKKLGNDDLRRLYGSVKTFMGLGNLSNGPKVFDYIYRRYGQVLTRDEINIAMVWIYADIHDPFLDENCDLSSLSNDIIPKMYPDHQI